jgi:hypothetical protein
MQPPPINKFVTAFCPSRFVFRRVLFSGHLLCLQHFLFMDALGGLPGGRGNLSVNARG